MHSVTGKELVNLIRGPFLNPKVICSVLLFYTLAGQPQRVLLVGNLPRACAQTQPQITIVVLEPSPGSRWKLNELVRFRARIEQDGNIVRAGSSHLAAVVRFPAGLGGSSVTEHVALYDDGEISHGDEEAGDGTRNNLLKAKAVGDCTVFWKAEVNGKEFYRQPKQYTLTVEPAPEEPSSPTVSISPTPTPEPKTPVSPVPPRSPPKPPTPGRPFPWWLVAVPGGLIVLVVLVLRARVAHGKLPALELFATIVHTETKERETQNFVFSECAPNATATTAASLGSSSISDFVLNDAAILPTHATIERTGTALFLQPVENAEVVAPDDRRVEGRQPLALGPAYRIGPFSVSFQERDLSITTDVGDESAPQTA